MHLVLFREYLTFSFCLGDTLHLVLFRGYLAFSFVSRLLAWEPVMISYIMDQAPCVLLLRVPVLSNEFYDQVYHSLIHLTLLDVMSYIFFFFIYIFSLYLL